MSRERRQYRPPRFPYLVVIAGLVASNAWFIHLYRPQNAPAAPAPTLAVAPVNARPETGQRTAPEVQALKTAQSGPDMDSLWAAVCQVESNGDASAIGDGGDSWGIAQISTICVRDCNRITGYRKWSEGDRFCPQKSRQMFDVYLNHYGGTVEERARKWNGGPDGHTQNCTLGYWGKIQKNL